MMQKSGPLDETDEYALLKQPSVPSANGTPSLLSPASRPGGVWHRRIGGTVLSARQVYLPIAAIFLASRAVLLLVALLTATQADPAASASGPLLSYLCRFDCTWYLQVAEHGYSTVESDNQPGATNLAFYPLFPMLIRLLSGLLNWDAFHAAIALSNVCFCVALVYIYRYARSLNMDHGVALLSVGLLCVLPQSIVFSAVYTESLFLLLLVVAMFHLRNGNYLVAGIAAALLSATRANGAFFMVFALAWLVRNGGLRALLMPWQAPEKFIPLVFAPMGLFAFWTYCFVTTGDAFAGPSSMYHGWGWYFVRPWEMFPAMLRMDGAALYFALASLSVFLCSLLLLRQRLYEEFLFCAALILMMSSGAIVGSIFRYWLVLFPVWIVVAQVIATRPVLSVALFSTVGLLNVVMMSAWTLHRVIAI